jgi:hypothetical protein
MLPKKSAQKESRQARWQRQRKSNGLCIQCGKPAAINGRCELCRDKDRKRVSDNYRLKVGIPIGRAKLKMGQPKLSPK